MRKYRRNITEEELIDLFRKAAQAHEPYCDPKSIAEGWQTIEASMDRKRKRRVMFVLQFLRSQAWLLCLLIISGLLLVPMRFNNKKVTVINDREAADNRRPSLQRVSAGGVSSPDRFHEQVLPAGSKPALYKTAIVQFVIDDPSASKHATDKAMIIDHHTDQTDSRNMEPAIEITPTVPLDISAVIAVPVPDKKITAVSLPQPGDTIEKKAAMKTPTQKYSRWSVGVLAATEWNKGGPGLNGPGLTAGLLIQYKLSPRLSIETGLLLSNKRYSADSASYKPNGNIYHNLLGVDADCRVIDVPVNLRYDLLQSKKHLVFARAGLSSFWMQEENYDITRLNNGTVEEYKLQLFNKNHHPFSVLNLGIGYERQLKNISLQVSPYVKLPLTGTGNGDVKLVALGTSISASYRFTRKK